MKSSSPNRNAHVAKAPKSAAERGKRGAFVRAVRRGIRRSRRR